MIKAPFRRIVTAHDDRGRSIIAADGPPPRAERVGGITGPVFYEIWNTREMPARIHRVSHEPGEKGIVLHPPKNGTRIRVLDIPPEDERIGNMSAEQARAHFAEIGAADAHDQSMSRHAFMHRTETVDYGIVLEGEIFLLVDEGETLCRAGDIVVQCGTRHGWSNRSGKNCRIAFILVDGEFDEQIA